MEARKADDDPIVPRYYFPTSTLLLRPYSRTYTICYNSAVSKFIFAYTDLMGKNRVSLHATDESALDKISLSDLKKFAAEPEVGGGQGGGSLEMNTPIEPGNTKGSAVKETH